MADRIKSVLCLAPFLLWYFARRIVSKAWSALPRIIAHEEEGPVGAEPAQVRMVGLSQERCDLLPTSDRTSRKDLEFRNRQISSSYERTTIQIEFRPVAGQIKFTPVARRYPSPIAKFRKFWRYSRAASAVC